MSGSHDDVCRLVRRERVRVDHDIVVRRKLTLDVIEALEVFGACRVVLSDELRRVGGDLP